MDVQRILEYLREEASRPLKAKELANALGISGEAYRPFRDQLREMEDAGLIYKQRKGRYAVPEKLNLRVGRLQVTRSGDGFVLAPGEEDDLFVPERHLGTAVDGDIVVARVERRRSHRNPDGRVLRVLTRAWSQVVGVYHRTKNYGFLAPQEPDLRKDVFIPPDFEGGARDGEVVVAEIVDWGEEGPSPVGRVLERLGAPGEPGVDILSIIHGHQLPLEFPADVHEEASEIASRGLTPADLEGREDLREELSFTIDPPDAKDHDDALSCRVLENGLLQVGVHIADVSYYVRKDTALDGEALERGTSVYLVDRVIPMLPHALSSDLCSLKPDVDRLAMSVLITMDSDGHVQDSRLVKSVIRSRHRLSYDEAQEMLDGDREAPADLMDALRRLLRASRGVRERREGRGSIDFDLPESRVVLNASGEPTDIERVLRLSTHRLIEDLMILANEIVARIGLAQELPFLYRVHEEPSEEKMEQLRSLAATFGYHLPAHKIAPRDLAKLVKAMEDTPQEQLISTATLRSMRQARYSEENLGHFGLASEAYSHFTSPIRRYPDLFVHRQLTRWLTSPEETRGKPGPDGVHAIAEHCSERERRAVEAERDSVDLKKIEFMERHLGDEFPGTISGVTAFGLFVLLDEFHVDGLVHVSTLEDDYYVYFEEQHALIGQRRRRKFQLGDRVRVHVVRVDREERQIDFELLDDGDGGS